VFEEAHGANLLVLPSGEIMCAWFSGNEGKNGVAVVLSRLHPGAMEWTAPAIVEGGYEFGYAVRPGWIALTFTQRRVQMIPAEMQSLRAVRLSRRAGCTPSRA
jgi:hypothetical protein